MIELLVVVLIIGILSAIALPQYTRAVERARATEAVQMVGTLEKAIDRYILENGMPTWSNKVEFFGTNANGSGSLDIDIAAGMDCSMSGANGTAGTACGNKYWKYSAYCGGVCNIHAYRLQAQDNTKYDFDFYSYSSPTGDKWTRTFIYGWGTDYKLIDNLGSYFTQS